MAEPSWAGGLPEPTRNWEQSSPPPRILPPLILPPRILPPLILPPVILPPVILPPLA